MENREILEIAKKIQCFFTPASQWAQWVQWVRPGQAAVRFAIFTIGKFRNVQKRIKKFSPAQTPYGSAMLGRHFLDSF